MTFVAGTVAVASYLVGTLLAYLLYVILMGLNDRQAAKVRLAGEAAA